MKRIRRTISAGLTLLMLLVFLIPSAAAFKNGDVVNYYLFTDIVTYINKIPIRSYNIDGYTAIVVEDLANYGFDVVWSAGARTLSVTRNTSKRIIGGFEPGPNTGKVGNRAGEVYFTDIVTYFDGQAVKSYNIGGRTIAYVDDLAEFYKETYVWDPYARTLSLTLRGAPTPPPPASPLAITAQPKNAVANKGDAVSFEVTVKGGREPYSYQWQVKQGSSGSWNNTAYTSKKMTFFVSEADLDNPNYYRCVIIDSESDTVTSDTVSVSTAQSGTFTVTLPFETISVFSTEVFTISVTENGGKSPYTYQWYHGTSLSNFTAIASTAKTISFRPDPAPTIQYLKCAVIDKNGAVAETAPLKITLKDVTLTAKLNKTNISVAVNEVFTLSCAAAGGTSPYTYKWFFGDKNGVFTDMTTYLPEDIVTGSSITAKPDPNHPVQYLKCQVTDKNGIAVFSDVCTIFLNALLNPPVATLDKTSIVVDVNEALTLNCSVTGGKSPYTYKWFFGDKNGNFTDMTTYYNPVSAVTGNSITARPDPNHPIQYLKCQVTDKNGTAVFSNVCTIKPTMAPLKVALDRESLTVLSGISFTITCEAEGGLAPYKYKWQIGYKLPFFGVYYTDAGCATKSITDYYPGDQSAYYYRCTVTDAKNNVVASNSCKVVKFTLPPIYP